jgi:tryptophan synthase alpha subunit
MHCRTNIPFWQGVWGFGIGTPEQAKQVGALENGVMVGSACVKTIGSNQMPVETAKQFTTECRGALQKESK